MNKLGIDFPMSLRIARSMGDILNDELTSSDTPHTAASDGDDDDDNDSDYLHYDFPQPPSIAPALRRMHSSPWYSQQLMALAKPERRHSVSPLIQYPHGWTHRSDSSHQDAQISKELVRMGLVSPDLPKHPEEGNSEHLKHPIQSDQFPSRRLDRLPPPAPAPSIPLPRLPRIIRKVASMRSESKQELVEPVAFSRRPVPKIRSLKFMSGSAPGSNPLQSFKQEERKRSWSLSRPTSFQRAKDVPVPDATCVALNSTNDQLSASLDRAHLTHTSPTVCSNPCSIECHFSQGNFNLSRRNPSSLDPPFAHRMTPNSGTQCYSNANCGEDTIARFGYGPSKTGPSVRHEHAGPGRHRTSHQFYGSDSGSKGNNASSGTLLQDAKSFINITPERRKSKSKSGNRSVGPGNEGGGMGHQVGSAMKAKGEKMKRLFARASSGVVDWGRQLTGRTAKSISASSTSGSLAPLTGM